MTGTIGRVALGGGVEIVAATRDVEFEMVRRAFAQHGARERFRSSADHEAPGDVAITFEPLGPLTVRALAERRVAPVAPREEGASVLLFFYSLYPDAVSAYLSGEHAAKAVQVAEAVERLLPSVAPRGARFLLLNVFRHVSPPAEGPSSGALTPGALRGVRGLRDRIRRFNREALRLALSGGFVLVDIDDAMAQEGARALGCDHSCDSEPAIDRGARAIADRVLGLELAPDVASPVGDRG
jgi:hypothetical protein